MNAKMTYQASWLFILVCTLLVGILLGSTRAAGEEGRHRPRPTPNGLVCNPGERMTPDGWCVSAETKQPATTENEPPAKVKSKNARTTSKKTGSDGFLQNLIRTNTPGTKLHRYLQQCRSGGPANSCRLAGNEYRSKNNSRTASKLYRIGCKRGDADSCTTLGLEDSGAGRCSNSKSASYYKRACDSGSAFGCVGLATDYECGCGGVKKSRSSALRMYRRACDMGESSGCDGARQGANGSICQP